MKHKLLKTLTTTIAIFGCTTALADVWIFRAKVEQVYTGYTDDRVYFKLSKDTNPANCPKANTYLTEQPYNTKGTLATLLTAKATKNTVSVRVSSSKCAANGYYPAAVTLIMD